MKFVLGVSFGYHDSSVALLSSGGNLLEVHDEERFSRRKHDGGFPQLTLGYLKNKYSLSNDNIIRICYYEDPRLKLRRIAGQIANSNLQDVRKRLPQIITSWADGKLNAAHIAAEYLNVDKAKVFTSDHHLSHICSSIYLSGYSSGAYLTLDGVGEIQTGTSGRFMFRNDGTLSIEKHKSMKFPDSIGLFYSAVTHYLGFEVNEGEFKVMGLAPYGLPIYKDVIHGMFTKIDGLNTRLRRDFFAFNSLANCSFTSRFVNHIGVAPREPESRVGIRETETERNNAKPSKDFFYADFAASCQSVVEDIILECATSLSGLSEKLVCSGGVFYNSVANGKLQQSRLFDEIFVYPAAGDSGTSVGSAFAYFYKKQITLKSRRLHTIYLGREYSSKESEKFLADHRISYKSMSIKDACIYLAGLLSLQKVIGIFNGRAEHGPRSLGNRSIVASPLSGEMKDIVNSKIKYREQFRPFAPATTESQASRYFHISDDRGLYKYMLATCQVREDLTETLRATTHIDNSARLQIVSSEDNLFFYSLINEFGSISGHPVLLNTSFNVRGEPIVDSLEDALSTFFRTNIDALYVNGMVVLKSDNIPFR